MDIDNSTVDQLKDKIKRDSLYIKKLEDDIADKNRINDELQKKINDYESPVIKMDGKDTNWHTIGGAGINWSVSPSVFNSSFTIGNGNSIISSGDDGMDIVSDNLTYNKNAVLTDKTVKDHIDGYMSEITEDGIFGFISSFSKENILLRKIHRALKNERQ